MENHREKLEKSIQEFKSLLKEDFKFHSEDQSTGVKIEISSKQINDLPNIVKGRAIINGSVDQFMNILFYNKAEERKKWDPQINSLKYIKEIEKDYEILCVEYDSPSVMVSNRDFLFLRHKRKDEDGCHYISSISLEEPNEHAPRDGVVRALLLTCAWRFKPLENGETEVIYMNHCNFNGWVPNWVVNTGIYDQPLCIGRVHSLLKN